MLIQGFNLSSKVLAIIPEAPEDIPGMGGFGKCWWDIHKGMPSIEEPLEGSD